MKKILAIIFSLIIIFGFKSASAGAYLTVVPPLDSYSYKVGNSVPITITIRNTPEAARKINFYISDTALFDPFSAQNHLKANYTPPAAGGEATFLYTWDTTAAQSKAGQHFLTVYLLNESGNPIDQDTQTFTLLGDTGSGGTGSGSGTTGGSGSGTNSGTTTGGGTTSGGTSSAGSFNIAGLGTVTFLPTKINSAQELIVVIINWLLGLMGVLAVIAIVYSGLMYITAGADQTKAENAKKNLTWAIIGVVIVLLSFAIVTWIGQIIKP